MSEFGGNNVVVTTSVVEQMLCELAFLRPLSLNWNESTEKIERRLPKLLFAFDRQ